MSHAAQLAQRIVVQHREPGFLRLELPDALCVPALSAALEQGLTATAGIASATVDAGWKRISIRYDAQVLRTAEVARVLFGLLADLPCAAAPAVAETALPAGPGFSLEQGFQPWLDKLKAMILPAEPAPAGSLQARFQPIVESALTEKAITNFFNDIVAFYLIKAHWELITKRWLQQPLANSNAWLTTFYLVFLLVRYRKTNSVK